jgi:anti-anti-sigma factor
MESETPAEIQDGTLTVRRLPEASTCRIELAGELDLSNCKCLAGEIEKAERDGAEEIALDLTELEFIDSTGIALLVSAHHRLNDGAERLRLIGRGGPEVQRVLSLTGLDAALPFVESDA